MSSELPLSPFPAVLEAFSCGQPVIMVDARDRENEGDLVVPTACISPDLVAFMMREGRGLICASISHELAAKLELPAQTLLNNSPFGTPFTVSIDHVDVAECGVTAAGRSHTMRALLADGAKATDFVSPGHVFPLVANRSGVFGRRGQTEGSFDLARIAGFEPSGVICEILNPDGTMARDQQLLDFAKRFSMPVTSVEAVLRYRVEREIFVREIGRRRVSTMAGDFEVRAFHDDATGKEHLALIAGNLQRHSSEFAVLARVHSECLTGDLFTSRRCDCGLQLDSSLQAIQQAGSGVVLYLRQEGRGIGLANKVKAYALQELCGHDTVEANEALGYPADLRDFMVAARIFEALGVNRVRLITNNPRKIEALEIAGMSVTERIPTVHLEDPRSFDYLRIKQDKLGHLLGIS